MEIEPRQEQLNELYHEIFGEERQQPTRPLTDNRRVLSDDALILKATLAKNGNEFKSLWDGSTLGHNGDDSAADMALMNILAFWTGGNAAQMERLFSRSGLGQRAKWRDRADYRERTIQKAISEAREFYEPLKDVGSSESDTEVSEEELDAIRIAENPRLIVSLEPDNAIVRYIEYGKATCDAYPEYHYGFALSLLSIATNRNLVLKLKQGDVFPNIWVFLLGRSTISRKTAALSKGQRFADNLFPYTALPQSYSPEGLVEALSETPRAYMIKDEASTMLAAMAKNYMLEMRDLYCVLYDCQSYKRKLRSGQRKEKRNFDIQNPFMNIITATTPEAFREYTSLLDLTSGWLLRFIYFYPNYRKDWMAFKPACKEDFELYGEVLGRLSKVKGLLYNREAPVEIDLTKDAWSYYQAWQETREAELQDTTDAIELALWGRLSFYALKLSMLFTVGRADFQEGSQVSLEHIKEACRQVDDYFLPVGKLVADEVAREETTNLQNKILGTLSRSGGKMKSRDLLKVLHTRLRDVEEALEALTESEEISQLQSGKTKWILLRQINRKQKSQVRVKTTATDEVSHTSHVSQNNKCRINSGMYSGIFATHATNATLGTVGTVGAVNTFSVGDDDMPSSGPHPRRDEPTPTKKKPDSNPLEVPEHTCYLAKVRAAAIIEYGYHGWVEPAKVAGKIGLLECQTMRALEHLGYERYGRSGGGIGYRQKRVESPGRAEA